MAATGRAAFQQRTRMSSSGRFSAAAFRNVAICPSSGSAQSIAGSKTVLGSKAQPNTWTERRAFEIAAITAAK